MHLASFLTRCRALKAIQHTQNTPSEWTVYKHYRPSHRESSLEVTFWFVAVTVHRHCEQREAMTAAMGVDIGLASTKKQGA